MDRINEVLPYLVYAIPVLAGVVALAVTGKLKSFARQTVSAVYKVAISQAEDLQDEGLQWLRGAEGVAYRKALAERAYDALPSTLWGIPVGLVKVVVSREVWVATVQRAFDQMASLAEEIQFPAELFGAEESVG